MIRYILTVMSLFSVTLLFAQQNINISGKIYEAGTNEPLFGARIVCDSTYIAEADMDGLYTIEVPANATHTIVFTFINLETKTIVIKAGSENITRNVIMEPEAPATDIDEVIVTAELGKARETPVAISTIDAKKISEELGTRDLPMILNSTPGAYATEQGGGSGDARVSIRGFDQRNVAVLVDGVPVNDMENGQVYWSNWDGLGDITRYMQVQRGLGASKLAIVSVGGTMNIVTKGLDQKLGASIKQEINDYGLYKTSFGFNTGRLKGNWGIALAGSRKWGSGFADATYTDAYSYFIKIQKRFDKHLFSLSANGAPQSHGQRLTRLPIAVVNKELAEKAGINYREALDSIGKISSNNWTTPTQGARGTKYNPNYGYVNGEVYNERINYFHKPQFNLTHSWIPNDSMKWTTTVYASIGKGGGTALRNTGVQRDSTDGTINFQTIYDNNQAALAPLYDPVMHPSGNFLRTANNDHKWVGVLSTFNFKPHKYLTAMVGLDGRYYKGSHYQSIYDLLGGDYAIDNSNLNQPKGFGNTQYAIKHVGDTVGFYNDAFVKWLGTFGQLEFKKGKWTAFVTGSVSETGYQRVDYFKKKDLVFDDTIMVQRVGYGDTVVYNGNKYTNQSAEARNATTKEKWFLGATVKGGANYNIDAKNNVFMNAGFLNIAPRMSTVFDNNNKEFLEIKNQKVTSVEAGYGFKEKRFRGNVNVYYTLWRNKPPSYTPTVETADGIVSYNINGLDALHKGIEFDATYRLLKKFEVEGLASIGDWKTISGSIVNVTNDQGQIVDQVDFSAKNVHVGDAAQIQLGGGLRYQILSTLYLKLRYTYFDKNYANFDPIGLQGVNKDRESWKMPAYGLLDFNFGYDFNISKLRLTVSGAVLNILDEVYITDAQNGQNFNAETATVFVGMGRRFSLGLKVAF